MPLTDIIEEELLATLDAEGDPQAVLDRHAGSKGPLYAALARATVAATARFGEMRGKLREAQARCRESEGQAKESERRAVQAQRRASAAEERLAAMESALAQRQALLARADALAAAGFDENALARLGEALDGATQAEGKPAAEVVAAFLDAAADWRHLAELRTQVAAAEDRAQQAEAACRRREREAKVRTVAVDWALWLVRQKISAETVGAWQAAADRLGLGAEALATGLARALEEHGSMEAARAQWTAAVAQLRTAHAQLTEEVAALRRERDGLTAAIGAVRDTGIARVRATAEAAAAEVRRAAAEFQRLTAEAAELREDLCFAQALRSGDPALWQRVEPRAWQALLARLEQWSQGNLANPEVPLPDEVRKQAKGSNDYPTLYGPFRVPLHGLLAWLQAGLVSVDVAPVRALPPPTARRDGGASG